ncbi:MAG TPA: hypothetical protein VNN55_06500 [bacterium]|nr:hypothetical protein [bacterium]
MDSIEQAYPDSIATANKRAGAQGLLPTGTRAELERKAALEPLADSISVRWHDIDDRIRTVMAAMDEAVDSLEPVAEFRDLFYRRHDLKIRKDSLLEALSRSIRTAR